MYQGGEVAFWSGSRDLKSRFSSLLATDLSLAPETSEDRLEDRERLSHPSCLAFINDGIKVV